MGKLKKNKNLTKIIINLLTAVFFTDKLSNTDTIKRLWAMVQENRADLRGKNWEERQRQGGVISKQIVFIDPKQLKMFSYE